MKIFSAVPRGAVVITGASAGIGRATALALASPIGPDTWSARTSAGLPSFARWVPDPLFDLLRLRALGLPTGFATAAYAPAVPLPEGARR
jgi:NAD(P)-dependent dehydrogenase (short-subunit alcohol dehydrogenase family)